MKHLEFYEALQTIMGISLLVLNGYLVKDDGNLAKLQSMHCEGRLGLGLIAIDEAHLIFD